MSTSIAIITDDLVFSNLLVTLLKRKLPDSQIAICESQEKVDNYSDKNRSDLILVDGGITAFSSIGMIQYLRMTKRIIAPIWFFPEIITNEYIHKANEMGVSKIVHKPFDPYMIANEIVSQINNK